MNKSYALLSLYDKKNLRVLCSIFKKFNIEIIATSSTAKEIRKIGHKCQAVSKLTKFKEILEGRVKTLHPKLYASILHKREEAKQIKEFKKLKFPKIDLVVINLYPFSKFIFNNKINPIEMIDIGGVSLLRAAAKNYNSVTPIYDIGDYKRLSIDLNNNNGKTSLKFRKNMASKVYAYTSAYDIQIAKWLKNKKTPKSKSYLDKHKKIKLRYGENPHQKASYYEQKNINSIYNQIIHKGKNLSYNNLLDIDTAIECIKEFSEPSCVIIKHNNPCGAASSHNISSAFKKAYLSDKISAFGGIAILNRKISTNLAKIISKKFFEIILAPNFDKESKDILSKRKKLTLIKINKLKNNKNNEIKKIFGGYLAQEKNMLQFKKSNMKLVSNKKASKKLIEEMIFAFKISKHTKSNSIVLVKNKAVVSMGIGQTSRIASTKIAISKLNYNNRKKGFVAASDAFFPFLDSVKLLFNYNCKAIIQPSGSINDSKIIDFANKYKLPLYFTKYRFFKH
tara:strand:- start:6619 stop:8142 length:1524 start_codon:yes stop_codon:yes gene_type:complete